jgi:hypothetical protein
MKEEINKSEDEPSNNSFLETFQNFNFVQKLILFSCTFLIVGSNILSVGKKKKKNNQLINQSINQSINQKQN